MDVAHARGVRDTGLTNTALQAIAGARHAPYITHDTQGNMSLTPNFSQRIRIWFQSQLANAGYYLSRDAEHRKDIARIEKYVASIAENVATDDPLESARLQVALAEEEHRIRVEVAAKTPENLLLRGRRVFSQADEDGIIAAIFANLDGRKTFIEIACGNGLENNTHLLLLCGWKGVWVDGSERHIDYIQAELGGLMFPRLLVERQFIDLDNVGALIKRYCDFLGDGDVDFFSLDIDGNDLAILKESLKFFAPRVICVEYNAKFPPPLEMSIRYDASHLWAGDDYQGCSLMALVEATRSRYTLLTCGISGVNAFFVRNDLAHRFRIYSPEDLYQPARYHRVHQIPGHRSTLKWVRNVIREDRAASLP